MIYFCSQTNRRALVLQSSSLNGIDYLEVSRTGGGCGTRLLITMLKDARHLTLTPSQISITGGGPRAQLTVQSVSPGANATPRLVTAELNQSGDFSTYTLSLVANPSVTDPPAGFDPQLSTISFSFRAGCPTVGDCLPTNCCPGDTSPAPNINYLAKDFGGFVQVMLDRLAVLCPDWKENHPADMGVALVEVLAYAADHLSYQQDAVSTEAYLGTARSRISLRRHAKLVDYSIGEGSNARAYVYVNVSRDGVSIPAGTLIFPYVPGFPTAISPNSLQASELLNNSPLGFATLQDATLYQEQNAIQFYTWSDTNCCLAPGTTQATLAGTLGSLAVGDILIFEEFIGPDTGDPQDANPANRWPVRLTSVRTTDYLNEVLIDPLNGQAVTQVSWNAADALPFPLCISSTTDAAHGSIALTGVSVARGNILLADHGIWQPQPPPGVQGPVWEDLGLVPAPPAAPVSATGCSCGTRTAPLSPVPRYFPQLAMSPVTFAWPLDTTVPASQFLAPASSGTSRPSPQIVVQDDQGDTWTPLADLLSSPDSQRAFVLEIERNGSAFLRFGDGQYGMAPETGTDFQAQYRVGNGSLGNVGRDTLGHLITNVQGIAAVRNPLAAAGGVDPETMDQIRQEAPYAFMSQLRAVTEADYAAMAQLDPAIRAARGTFRWTGSWYTAFVSIDAAAPNEPDATMLASTESRLNLYRMAGTDLAVEGAVLVGLRIEMDICVDAGAFQDDVYAALMQRFTMGNQSSGQTGVLNPVNFAFGQTIYTSPLVTAAQEVEGVTSAALTVFQRLDDPTINGAARGYLTMGRLEIARCDNDPTRLDLGILVFHMDGGK